MKKLLRSFTKKQLVILIGMAVLTCLVITVLGGHHGFANDASGL